MEFAWRERGLVTADAAREAVAGLADLRGLRVVPRQPEAGSQALLIQLMQRAGLEPDAVVWTAPSRTETDAVASVARGQADVTFGLSGLAKQFSLGFVPVIRERFDLLVDRRAWFEPPVQAFIAFCATERFASKAAELGGYDVSSLGRVHFNGA